MKTVSRVFLFEESSFDVSKAADWGDIVYLHSLPNHRPSIFEDNIISYLEDKLRKHRFNPELDYIAVTGQLNKVATLITAACNIRGSVNAVNLLCFDARSDSYLRVSG